MVTKNEAKLRKDFYAFQSKVNRLEEIKNELKKLDLRGFEKEASIIKSMLKDTTAISEIEKLMKDLRNKILNKRHVRKKSPLKKIEKNVEDLTDTNLEIKNEIKSLKSSLDAHINKRPKTDSDVNIAVDSRFNDFVNNLKLELTEKVKNKENQLNDQLKQDILVRKEELEKKYHQLDNKLKQEYNNKLKTELQKEITQKFSEELRKRFDAERSKLDLFYVTKLKQKYKEEFEKRKRILEAEFRNNIQQEIKKRELEEKKRILEVESEYRKKIADVEKSRKNLDRINAEKQRLLDRKIKELDDVKSGQVNILQEYQHKIKNQLANEAHEKLFNELNKKKIRLNEELKKQFELRMNDFVEEQKKKQAKEIAEKTSELKEFVDHEHNLNILLSHNLSEKIYALEKQKQINRDLIFHQSKLKNDEIKKRMNEHKLLVDQHKIDIQNLTNKLKQSFHNRYDAEIKKHVSEEKQRLQLDFNTKLKEMSEKMSSLSLIERINLRRKLKQEYNDKLNKSINIKKKKIQEQFRREFGHKANEQILLEKKKLENRLKELEAKYSARESEIKLKEKLLLESQKAKSIAMATEKKKLIEKINFFRKSENEKIKNERLKLKKEFALKAHEEMIQELKKREEAIKAMLQKKFNDKIKETTKTQEELLSRKKAELARELEDKAKALRR